MRNVRAETATHGQQRETNEPVLPSKLDIQEGYEHTGDKPDDEWQITLGKPIPLDGPLPTGSDGLEGSRVRVWIAIVVLVVWGLWVIFGGARLALTGDSSMLHAVPEIVTFPVGVVFGYYFAGGHQRFTRRSSR